MVPANFRLCSITQTPHQMRQRSGPVTGKIEDPAACEFSTHRTRCRSIHPTANLYDTRSFHVHSREKRAMSYYDEIEIEDMTYHEVQNRYTYPCPCGDLFEIYLDDLRDGEDVATCPSCSLQIKVIFEVVCHTTRSCLVQDEPGLTVHQDNLPNNDRDELQQTTASSVQIAS